MRWYEWIPPGVMLAGVVIAIMTEWEVPTVEKTMSTPQSPIKSARIVANRIDHGWALLLMDGAGNPSRLSLDDCHGVGESIECKWDPRLLCWSYCKLPNFVPPPAPDRSGPL